VGSRITLAAKVLLDSLLGSEGNGIPRPLPEVGPFFQLVSSSCQTDHKEFTAFLRMHVDSRSGKMRIESDSQSDWSSVNTLVKFAEAEGLDVAQVKPIVRMTVRAMRYGIALMMPSLPFVITQTVRRYLNERRIPFVFSTHEMAVGINYGLRNVIILQTDPAGAVPGASLLVQMAGRAGRRGLDKDARILYGNVLPGDVKCLDVLSLEKPLYPADTPEAVACSVRSLDTLRKVPGTEALPFATTLMDTLRRAVSGSRARLIRELVERVSLAVGGNSTAPYQLPPGVHAEDVYRTLQDFRAATLACYQLDFLPKWVAVSKDRVREASKLFRAANKDLVMAVLKT
jgi:hypothetical protein